MSRMDSVVRGTGTLEDRDEVNKRDKNYVSVGAMKGSTCLKICKN